MMIAGIFEVPASLLAFFYAITTNYALAISLIAVVVMLLVTPLNLKSTKGMLEMQRLAPEMRKLQNEYKGDRQKLNEEMMKLYQEHKVNPMASCLPLVAQMPVFIIMFRILHGMTYKPSGGDELVAQSVLDAGGDTRPIGFVPRYLSHGSELYQSLVRSETMTSFGLDLSKSPAEMLGAGLRQGPRLRRAGGAARPALLGAAADGRLPGGGQPDDVARPAEADAVPAGRLRRVPGVLPARSGRLLPRPDRAADRPAVLHHEALLLGRRVARPPGAGGERPRPRARQGRRRERSAGAGQARPDATPASDGKNDAADRAGRAGADASARRLPRTARRRPPGRPPNRPGGSRSTSKKRNG